MDRILPDNDLREFSAQLGRITAPIPDLTEPEIKLILSVCKNIAKNKDALAIASADKKRWTRGQNIYLATRESTKHLFTGILKSLILSVFPKGQTTRDATGQNGIDFPGRLDPRMLNVVRIKKTHVSKVKENHFVAESLEELEWHVKRFIAIELINRKMESRLVVDALEYPELPKEYLVMSALSDKPPVSQLPQDKLLPFPKPGEANELGTVGDDGLFRFHDMASYSKYSPIPPSARGTYVYKITHVNNSQTLLWTITSPPDHNDRDAFGKWVSSYAAIIKGDRLDLDAIDKVELLALAPASLLQRRIMPLSEMISDTRKDLPAIIAVAGEKGSGKSTFIQACRDTPHLSAIDSDVFGSAVNALMQKDGFSSNDPDELKAYFKKRKTEWSDEDDKIVRDLIMESFKDAEIPSSWFETYANYLLEQSEHKMAVNHRQRQVYIPPDAFATFKEVYFEAIEFIRPIADTGVNMLQEMAIQSTASGHKPIMIVLTHNHQESRLITGAYANFTLEPTYHTFDAVTRRKRDNLEANIFLFEFYRTISQEVRPIALLELLCLPPTLPGLYDLHQV